MSGRNTTWVALAVTAILLGACGTGSGDDAEPFQAQVRTPALGNTEIAYYERGQGDPLLMLTGTGSTMAEWDPALLELLAEQRRLIRFDYPGVGLSGRWRGQGFDALADTAAGLIDELGLGEADILGWSMGGFVAQRLAVRHPQKVGRLILAGTQPGRPAGGARLQGGAGV